MSDKFHADVLRAKEAAGLPADTPHDKALMRQLRDHAEARFRETIGDHRGAGGARFQIIPDAVPGETVTLEARQPLDRNAFAHASVEEDGWQRLHAEYRTSLGRALGVQAAKAGYVEVFHDGKDVVARLIVTVPSAPSQSA